MEIESFVCLADLSELFCCLLFVRAITVYKCFWTAAFYSYFATCFLLSPFTFVNPLPLFTSVLFTLYPIAEMYAAIRMAPLAAGALLNMAPGRRNSPGAPRGAGFGKDPIQCGGKGGKDAWGAYRGTAPPPYFGEKGGKYGSFPQYLAQGNPGFQAGNPRVADPSWPKYPPAYSGKGPGGGSSFGAGNPGGVSYPKPTSGVPFTGSSSKGNPRVASSSPGGKNRPTYAPGKGKGNYLERHGFAPYSQLKGVNFPRTNKPIVIELDGEDDIMEEEDLSRVAPGRRKSFLPFHMVSDVGLGFRSTSEPFELAQGMVGVWASPLGDGSNTNLTCPVF